MRRGGYWEMSIGETNQKKKKKRKKRKIKHKTQTNTKEWEIHRKKDQEIPFLFFQFDLFNLTSFFQILKKIFIIHLFGIWNLELLIFIIFTEIVIKHFGYV